MSVVRAVEHTKTGANDRPVEDVVIADCGTLPVDAAFSVAREDAK